MAINKVALLRILALAVMLAGTAWQPVRAEDSAMQHGGDSGELTLDHRLENVSRAPQLDRGVARTGTFGFH